MSMTVTMSPTSSCTSLQEAVQAPAASLSTDVVAVAKQRRPFVKQALVVLLAASLPGLANQPVLGMIDPRGSEPDTDTLKN